MRFKSQVLILISFLFLALNPVFSQQTQSQEEYQKQLKEYEKKKAEIEAKNAEKKEELDKVKEENEKKELYNSANRAYKIRKYAEALSLYNKVLDMEACFTKALYGKGLALNKLRNYPEAIEAFREATECDPTYSRAFWGMGYNLNKIQKQDEAIAAFDKAITIDPSYSKAYYEKGLILYKQKYPAAADALKAAIDSESDYYLAYSALGDVYIDQGKLDLAIDALQKSVDINAKARPYYRLAQAQNMKGQHQAAANAAIAAMKVQSNYAPAAFEAGVAYKALQNYNEALKYFRISKNDKGWRKSADYEITRIQEELKKSAN